ncbi:chaperone protein HchA [Baffinella frigidus]|nr:chaperone protein HchA [Cryptophyta sp. CCMP2293]
MGCCTSRPTDDDTYEPSSFVMSAFINMKTDYTAKKPAVVHTEGGKVLVVCTDDGKIKMANGKVFSSGNHPVELLLPLMHFKQAGFSFEFATVSGSRVVMEMWAFPKNDAAVKAFYDEIKPLMESPKKLDAITSLTGFAGIFIPGGHGAMVNLPKSVSLGKLLHTAHAWGLPTISLCHGPATLLAAAEVPGAGFPYAGYKMVTFSDATDKMTPKLGYIPGPMPWFVQETLKAKGAEILPSSESGKCHVDRELVHPTPSTLNPKPQTPNPKP